MPIQPKFLTTGIGSMPFTDPDYAVDVILKNFPEAPYWPQLPKHGVNEQMEIQFAGGMPSAIIDREKNRLYFDTAADYSDELASFYEQYMAIMESADGSGDLSFMAIKPENSSGIYTLERKLQEGKKKPPFVKVQNTGPCSFALSVVDENKRAIYYNEEFRQMIIKTMALKSRWQIQRMRPLAENVICFIDEPILSAFGSSTYVTVQREEVVANLAEVIEAVHMDKAYAGIHCCGNTEWSILIDAGVDILSFDAFEYGETIAMYAESVKPFLEKGGMIAWGIIPTSTKIHEQTAESLANRLEQLIESLAAKGINKTLIAEQALITPSCGTGTLQPEEAEKVLQLTGEVSKIMKAKYGF